MKNEHLLNQVKILRGMTLKAMENVTEEQADIRPKGFNNTLRWQFGHILTVQSMLPANYADVPSNLPAHYPGLFANGTKPADWTQTPPSLDELRNLLREQTAYIMGQLENRLDEPITKEFVRYDVAMTTVAELLNYTLFHEGNHNGAIGGLKHAIEGQSL
jgi:uncharacterized damage-inducible protein DinB